MAFLAALFGARSRPVGTTQLAPARDRRVFTSLRAHRLSGLGAEADLAGDADATLLDEPARAYLALLARLPALVERSPAAVDDICAFIASPTVIRALRIQPFAFIAIAAALREATLGSSRGRLAVLPPLADPRGHAVPTQHRSEADRALAAVVRAIDAALANLPELGGRTLIALDESHAMGIGAPGQRPIDFGALFAAALAKGQPRVDLMRFSHVARYRHLDTTLPALTLAEDLKTDTHRAQASIQAIAAAAGKRRYERVIILSAATGAPAALEQVCADNRRRSGGDPLFIAVALREPPALRVVSDRVVTVGGRPDRLIEMIEEVEHGGCGGLLRAIARA